MYTHFLLLLCQSFSSNYKGAILIGKADSSTHTLLQCHPFSEYIFKEENVMFWF